MAKGTGRKKGTKARIGQGANGDAAAYAKLEEQCKVKDMDIKRLQSMVKHLSSRSATDRALVGNVLGKLMGKYGKRYAQHLLQAATEIAGITDAHIARSELAAPSSDTAYDGRGGQRRFHSYDPSRATPSAPPANGASGGKIRQRKSRQQRGQGQGQAAEEAEAVCAAASAHEVKVSAYAARLQTVTDINELMEEALSIVVRQEEEEAGAALNSDGRKKSKSKGKRKRKRKRKRGQSPAADGDDVEAEGGSESEHEDMKPAAPQHGVLSPASYMRERGWTKKRRQQAGSSGGCSRSKMNGAKADLEGHKLLRRAFPFERKMARHKWRGNAFTSSAMVTLKNHLVVREGVDPSKQHAEFDADTWVALTQATAIYQWVRPVRKPKPSKCKKACRAQEAKAKKEKEQQERKERKGKKDKKGKKGVTKQQCKEQREEEQRKEEKNFLPKGWDHPQLGTLQLVAVYLPSREEPVPGMQLKLAAANNLLFRLGALVKRGDGVDALACYGMREASNASTYFGRYSNGKGGAGGSGSEDTWMEAMLADRLADLVAEEEYGWLAETFGPLMQAQQRMCAAMAGGQYMPIRCTGVTLKAISSGYVAGPHCDKGDVGMAWIMWHDIVPKGGSIEGGHFLMHGLGAYAPLANPGVPNWSPCVMLNTSGVAHGTWSSTTTGGARRIGTALQVKSRALTSWAVQASWAMSQLPDMARPPPLVRAAIAVSLGRKPMSHMKSEYKRTIKAVDKAKAVATAAELPSRRGRRAGVAVTT